MQKKALEINPDEPFTHYLVARNDMELKKGPEAMVAVNEAIRLNPTYTAAYICRGVMYERNNDLDRAMADYRKALECDLTSTIAQGDLDAIQRRQNPTPPKSVMNRRQ